MRTMVEQVTDILDQEELSEFGKSLSQMGWGKSSYNKKTKTVSRPLDPTFYRHDKHWLKDKKNVKFLRKRLIDQEKETRRRKMKEKYPNKPLEWTGSQWVVKKTNESVVLEDDRDSEKEQQRKELKMRYPNVPLRWNGRKWILGKRKPSWKEIDSKRKKINEEIEHLEEISLRTGSIAVFLAKVKQYGNKVDQSVSRLRSLSNELKQSKDESDRNRIHGEIVKVESDVFIGLRKMSIYNSLVSGVSGLGNDRSYKLLKKMEKKKRR
jgi:hypothetical protein